MNFRRKKREKLDITLISMIDVLFVLLLFFMVSTTFNNHTQIKVQLPEADGAAVEQSSKMVTLTIDADGNYYLPADGSEPQKLADQQLETLKQALQKLPEQAKELPFIIDANGKTPHQAVITALQAAGEAGFSHITFENLHPKATQ